MEQDYYARFAAHHRTLIENLGPLVARVHEDVLNTPELLTYLWERLVPHAQAEEATLYRRAATLPGGRAMVEPLIKEHEVIIARTDELGNLFEVGQDTLVRDVVRCVWELIQKHFQKEETLLIPMLQKSMTPQAFRSLIEEAHRVEDELRPSDIKRLMDTDHRRIDRILAALSVVPHRDPEQATTLFNRGRAVLLRHICWEEDLLFPAFEAKTKTHDTGPTAVMRQEHTQIKAAMMRITHSLDAGDWAGATAAEQELTQILTVHNQKEEQILYALINKTLPAQERQHLLTKIV